MKPLAEHHKVVLKQEDASGEYKMDQVTPGAKFLISGPHLD